MRPLTNIIVRSAAQDQRQINVAECVVLDVRVGAGIAATAAGIGAVTSTTCVVRRVASVHIALHLLNAQVSLVIQNASEITIQGGGGKNIECNVLNHADSL